ncbi:uncharacterized protein LOC124489907 [Dermatophagoides farinae]|uniref:uncharacterized protein LOC124489907 n=1 Tax=Dermatophagoides farinae TaxID=6954 RepID=UPI003F5F318B
MLSAQQQQQSNNSQQSNLGPTKQSTGTITKILDNFGFIDDSVFFPLSVVKGGASQVKVGDKVFFECTYSKNLPFNWNATIVQPIHQQPSQQQPQPPPSLHQTSQSYQHTQSSPASLQQHHHQQSLHSVAPSHPSYNPSQTPPSSSSSSSLQSNTINSNTNNNPATQQQTNMYHSHNLPHQQQQQHVQPTNHPLSGGQLGYSSPVAGGHLGHPYHTQQQQQLSSLNSGQKPSPYGTASLQPPPSQPPQVYNPTVAYHPSATSGGIQSSQTTGSITSTNNSTVAAAAAAAAATVSPVDLAKAAAAVQQLSQYCTTANPVTNSTVGQQQSNPSGQYGSVGGGGGPGHHPGSLQYTSTPGSAFISSPFNQQSKPPTAPGTGGPSRQGSGRWDHQRDDPRTGGGGLRGPSREDPRSANRFGSKPSRFSDAVPERFQPPPSQPLHQQGPNQPTNFGRSGPDYSLGANQRKLLQSTGGGGSLGDQHSFNEDRGRFQRDKDFRHDNRRGDRDPKQVDNNIHKNLERQNDSHRRENRRDHRERDRTSKRSISPSPSLTSNSTAGGTSNRRNESSSASNLMSYLPKRRYEPCNIPKSSIIKNRYNSTELKSRFGSNTVHVPSDLKEIIYDVENDFDLFNMPKPILYKIIVPVKKDTSSLHHHHKENSRISKSSQVTNNIKPTQKDKDTKEISKDENDKEKQSDKSQQQPKPQEEESSDKKMDEIGQNDKKIENEQQLQTDTSIKSASTMEVDQPPTTADASTIQTPEEEEVDKEEQDKEEESNDTEKQSIENQQSIKTENETNAKIDVDTDVDDNDDDEHEHDDKIKMKTNEEMKKCAESDESSKHKDGEKDTKHSKKSVKVLSHKFNVKVLLISLPSLAEIYERLFGSEFPGPQSGGGGHKSANHVGHFHKLFQLLVTRNSNDGYSLIGGKFQRDLDGYMDNDEPNLINTAIRIVWEQTGLNLSSCRQWRVFSTFIYNRDNSIDPLNSGYEVTKIYFPDIWSSFDSIYRPFKNDIEDSNNISIPTTTDLKSTTSKQTSDIKPESNESSTKSKVESKKVEQMETNTDDNVTVSLKLSSTDRVCIKDVPNEEKKEYIEKLLQTMAGLKVAELKNELEKFYIRFESRWKKEQLFQRLQQVCQESLRILSGEDSGHGHSIGIDGQQDLTIGKSEDINMIDDHYEENQSSPLNSQMDDNEDLILLSGQKRKLDDSKVANYDDDNLANGDDEDESKSKETIMKKSKSEQQHEQESNDSKIEESPFKQHKKQLMDNNFTAIPSSIKVKTGSGQQPLSIVTLQSALNPHRFDQFELIIVAEFIRDSLTMHFARYILSSIFECIQQQKSIIPATLPVAANTDTNSTSGRIPTPINYVHLAFSYFEKGHCGYMLADDLNTLLQSTGFIQSKKTFQSLVSSLLSLANIHISSSLMNERIMYIFFPQPSQLIPRQIHYPTVSYSSCSSTNRNMAIGSADNTKDQTLIIERNSIQYNVEELIKQSEQDQKIKVCLQDSMTQTTKKIAHLENYVQELETKQKKMTAATGRQNEELCAVKRDRDQIKSKYEQLKKFCLKSVNDLNGLMKTLEGSNDPIKSSMDTPTTTTATNSTSATTAAAATPEITSGTK